MTLKQTLAGIGTATALIAGGDVMTYSGDMPVVSDKQVIVADEIVSVTQRDGVVETHLPWKGEDGLRVEYDLSPTLREKFTDSMERSLITETVDFGNGGFKVDIILTEKPSTNKFCYTFSGVENYDFFYQSPELSRAELAMGAMEREEHIKGSYAVYHKTRKHHQAGGINYGTGKVMHIPRPQVWSLSDEATKVWADLSYTQIDQNTGALCVTAPQDFLDTADYSQGVRIDPTFGYETQGATANTFQNFVAGSNFTSPSDAGGATVDSITFTYAKSGTGTHTVKGGIYESRASDAFVTNGASEELSFSVGTAKGWQTANFTGTKPTISASTEYQLMAWSNSVSFNNWLYFDSASSGTYAISDPETYGATFPDPLVPTAENDTFVFSVYVTYTVAPSGGTPNYQSEFWFD